MSGHPQPPASMKGLLIISFLRFFCLSNDNTFLFFCFVVGTVLLTKDFAAAIDHDKKFNKTCSHPERSRGGLPVPTILAQVQCGCKEKTSRRQQKCVVCREAEGVRNIRFV